MWAGLDFVCGELRFCFGLLWGLWFASSQCQVIDRLPHPHASKHIIRQEQNKREFVYLMMNIIHHKYCKLSILFSW